MAISLEFDLYGGEMQIGSTDSRYNRIVRRAIARDVPTTNDGLAQAIQQAFADVASGYTNQYGVPLAYIRAARWGPTKAFVTAVYQPQTFGQTSNDPTTLARMRAAYSIEQSFRRPTSFDPVGWPTGALYIDNGLAFDNTPGIGLQPNPLYDKNLLPFDTAQNWTRPVLEISVPFSLAANPLPSVATKIGHTNADKITMGGYLYDIGWVRFDGLSVDVIQTATTTLHYGHYHFTACNGGWFRESLFFNKTINPNQWQTQYLSEYPMKPFLNQFPYAPIPQNI